MDLVLSEEQRMIMQTIRRFVQEEIIPLEQQLDPDAYELPRVERERLSKMVAQMGFDKINDIPEEYLEDAPEEFRAGIRIDLKTRALMVEEMSQHRAGLYHPCYGLIGGRSAPPQLWIKGSPRQKEKYLWPTLRGEKHAFLGITEPSGGSDPARAIQTKGVRDGDDWVINGSKVFNSGADQADYGLVFVRTDPERGRAGITCFLIDTDSPGFQVRRLIHVLRSHYTTELSFDDVRVPHENVLGEVGGGFGVANETLARARIPYAAACTGVAIAAHRMATEYSRGRVTFGEPLANRQAIQWMLVDNELDIRCARWLTLQAAEKAERGEPFRFEASACKLYATEAASRVIDRSLQIHGGYGITRDLPLERWYREMRIRRIGEGPSEVQRIVMARDLVHGTVQPGAV